jgi:hypothetical protein
MKADPMNDPMNGDRMKGPALKGPAPRSCPQGHARDPALERHLATRTEPRVHHTPHTLSDDDPARRQ